MAADCTLDDFPDLMDVSLTSEYDRLGKTSEEVLNDVVRVLMEALLHCKLQPTEMSQCDEDFSAFTASLTPEEWTRINTCIQMLNCESANHSGTSKIKKKRKGFSREQIVMLEKEFTKCRSPDPSKCEQIAKSLKLPTKRVTSWFKKLRKASNSCSQSSSSGTVKLTLRLVKQSEDSNTWSVLRPDNNTCSLSASKSTEVCYLKDLPSPSSAAPSPSELSNFSGHFDFIDNISYTNSGVQERISVAKPPTVKRRSKMNPQQLQALEEEFSVSQFPSSKRRHELAKSLGLSENQLKNWFEYRRRRIRRQVNLTENSKLICTISNRQCKHFDVSSARMEKEFDKLSDFSSVSSLAWNLEDSQPYNPDVGSTALNEVPSSKFLSTSDGTSLSSDYLEEYEQFTTPYAREDDYSLPPCSENLCPNIGMS